MTTTSPNELFANHNQKGDDSTNDGSVVGLPVDAKSSSSSSEEEDERPLEQNATDKAGAPRVENKEENKEDPTTKLDQNHEKNDNDKPKLEALETSSTQSPTTTPPGNDDDDCPPTSTKNNNDNDNDNPNSKQKQSLEERVQELETKLATLSRILQQQQRLSSRSLLLHSPSNSQRNLQPQKSTLSPKLPGIPLMEDLEFGDNKNQKQNNNTNMSEGENTPDITDSPPLSQTRPSQHKGRMVPYLESPAPIEDRSPRQRSMHQRKRLSFHLLYDGNEDNLDRADDDEYRAEDDLHHNSHHHTHQHDVHVHIEQDSDGREQAIMAHVEAQDNNAKQNDNDGTGRDSEYTGHPLLNDKNNNNTSSGQGSTHHGDGAEPETTHLHTAKSQSTSEDGQVASNDALADVAARVVKAQAKAEAADSSHTSSVGRSGSLKKLQSFAASSPSSAKSATSEVISAIPPLGRAKAAILPPLLLSNDKRSKWLDHLNSFQESNHDVDIQMQEFIKVPGAVERTLISGFLICVDSFLYVWTILPIRFAWSCVLLSLHYFFKWTKKPPGKFQFHRRHTYQLIQVSIIFFIYKFILLPISLGKLYHWIRGQAMIKLYVLIAMVEVFDRLMCSLGQDCLDSLYWNTTRRPRSSRMLISISVVMVYTALHSLILFIHVCTLSVAMNSADEALLALLIAGNFAEIKSTVFKKYNKPSLFKIVASDICERFKLALFLGLVLLLNFCQGMDSRKMSDYQRIAGLVWMSELLCDWLKHAFITKFNFIPSSVYPEYGLLLAGDVTGIGHEGVNLDHSHAVVKRIGFAQMPLVCVMARLVTEAAKYMSLRVDSNAVPYFVIVLAAAVSWFVLLILKLFLGAYLQRTSLAKLHAAPELSQQTPLKNKQKQQ